MENIDLIDIYKSFLNNIPWPFWIVGIDSKIIFLNKLYEDRYNVKLKDIIGKHKDEVFTIEKSRIYNKQLEKCLETLSLYVTEEAKDGTFAECYTFPIL